MSPEYLTGGIITLQCDVYSLGVILIEMVTGHLSLPNIENVRTITSVILTSS